MYADNKWLIRVVPGHVRKWQHGDRLAQLAGDCWIVKNKFVRNEINQGNRERSDNYIIESSPIGLRWYLSAIVTLYS